MADQSISPPAFATKVIAFVDIVGFSKRVERATDDDLPGLIELTELLGKPLDAVEYLQYGPIACPNAPRIDKGLDFKITQVSDCVIISAECSPAGAINVIYHCNRIAVRMMQHRHLCRGSIVIGPIFHHGIKIIGEGYQRAFRGEESITAMSSPLDPESKGGPFIEVAPDLLAYLAEQKDQCAKDMLRSLTHSDGSVTAIYPYHGIAESHFCEVKEDFDAQKWRASVSAWRESWVEMRSDLAARASALPTRQAAKWHHVIKGVEHIISRADDRIRQLDGFIERGYGPRVGSTWGTL